MENKESLQDRQGQQSKAEPNTSPSTSTPHRRARTKEFSAGRAAPPSLIILDRTDRQSSATNDYSPRTKLETITPEPPHLGQSSREGIEPSNRRRGTHRRSPSAGFASPTLRDGDLERSNSTSSSTTSHSHVNRRSWVPNSPPSAWLSRKAEKGRAEAKSAAKSVPMWSDSGVRARSTSAVSPGSAVRARNGVIAIPKSTEDSLTSSPESSRRFSRRSTHTTPIERPEGPLSLVDLTPTKAQSGTRSPSIGQKDKRGIFGRREDSIESVQSSRGSGRRSNARSFYKSGNKQSREGANASSETIGSNGISDTVKRSEGLLNKSRSISRWNRRSLRADSASQEEQKSPSTFSSTSSQAAADGWDNDFVNRNDTSNGNAAGRDRSESINPSSVMGKEEGLPKRLGGWISTILNSSTNAENNGHLSASQSSSTIRRKASSISLSLKGGSSQGTASPLLASINTVNVPGVDGNTSHSPAPKPRSAGILSTFTNSSREGRAESPSSISSSSTGARTGLDRALRYFLDQGEGREAEEGRWLLGVWHGPERSQADHSTLSDVEIIHATPSARDSRSSTLESSSQSRRGSDIDFDDNSTGSRRTRETSPSVASASTRDSNHGHKDGIEDDFTTKRATLQAPQDATNAIQRHPSDASVAERGHHVASFQADYSSRIWCTYRSHFVPILRDGTITRQAEIAAAEGANTLSATAQSLLKAGMSSVRKAGDITPTDSSTRNVANGRLSEDDADNSQLSSDTAHADDMPKTNTSATATTLGGLLNVAAPANLIINNTLGEKIGLPNFWNRATAVAQAYGLTGRAGLTTDAGWGCMLRTGQSVLANALINVHLGRDWRREQKPSSQGGESDTEEAKSRQEKYAKYVRLLSWFMDEPSLACPFGVHRMAREGKRLGKEVGEWFGPSTAGGAIKKLVDEYPDAGIGASLASDGVVYLDQVRAQSQGSSSHSTAHWNRPVLVLIGVRLGLEGVHAMYHDSIKAIFTFPQSVGIAGGRPSSSYYFVGYQGNSLFYLDPHHVRASIPFRHPPSDKVDDTEWWTQAYSEAELSTFHTDRPRRMPMKTLDPSMLIGFLITDEASMIDFVDRVKALPRPIFSVLESMPKWMLEEEEGGLHDDERALESFSEDSHDEKDGNRSVVTEESDVTQNMLARGDPSEGSKSQERRRRPNLSVMSHDTMTPRSESTFEIVDRAQGILINDRDTEKEGDTIPIGSFTEISNQSSSDQSRLADDLSTMTLANSPSGHPVADKEESFTWEEVGSR